MNVTTLEDLMRISIDGPIVDFYNPEQAMVLWQSESGVERRPAYRAWPVGSVEGLEPEESIYDLELYDDIASLSDSDSDHEDNDIE